MAEPKRWQGVNSPKYRLVQREFNRIVKTVTPSVAGFTRRLFAKNLIPKEKLDDVEKNDSRSDESKASAVIRVILDKVEENDAHFDTMLSIMQQIRTLESLCDHLSKELTRMTHTQRKSPTDSMKGELNTNSELPLASVVPKLPQSMDAQTDQPLDLYQASLGSPEESPMTSPGEDTSTSQIKDQIGFCCLCGQCTVDKYLSGHCPALKHSSQSKKFPYLNTRSLDRGSVIDLEAKLNKETSEIVTKFADLVDSTIESLEKQKILPDRLATRVLSLKADPSAFSKPLLMEEENKLMKATSVSKIFKILTRYMSFYNHTILMHIIKKFGTEDDQKRRDDYLNSFEWFCKRTVFEVPSDAYCNAPNGSMKRKLFVVKVTRTTPLLTLEGVSPLQEKIAEIVGVKTSTLYLCRVDQGCVVLSFLVPAFIAREKFPLDSYRETILEKNGFKVVVDPSSKDNPSPAHSSPILAVINLSGVEESGQSQAAALVVSEKEQITSRSGDKLQSEAEGSFSQVTLMLSRIRDDLHQTKAENEQHKALNCVLNEKVEGLEERIEELETELCDTQHALKNKEAEIDVLSDKVKLLEGIVAKTERDKLNLQITYAEQEVALENQQLEMKRREKEHDDEIAKLKDELEIASSKKN